ncbi:MnmC family methyltransferase [Geitlerinema splendidum]|nr:MnmC family methyltransferase [Geitlerinema splendidum]
MLRNMEDNPSVSYQPQTTADGSFTFFSDEFGEAFHSSHGARLEAELKFIVPTQLAQKAVQFAPAKIHILDICYGLGYNTAVALETLWQANPNCQIEWLGLERDLIVPQNAITHNFLEHWSTPVRDILQQLSSTQTCQTPQLQAKLLIGDARETLKQVYQQGFLADAIFLDPFSPPHCPQLWTVEFLSLASQCLKPDGRLATYSCAASVRIALMQAGLKIGSTEPFGRRSPGTIASYTELDLSPLSQQEQEHLQTTAAIPYRDPQLNDPPELILQRRRQEQQASSLEPTTHWKKRWSTR